MPEPGAPVVALIRGINVGGRSKLSMTELRSTLSDAGFPDVRTHIQSGNLLITPSSGPKQLVETLEQIIEDRFGMTVRVITRTRKQLEDIIERNPFVEPDIKPSSLHAIFLESAPAAGRVADLDPDRSPPDRFAVSGTEVYLRYPNGSGRSKLSLDYFERKLEVSGTARNWNTVTRLSELLEDISDRT
jgi:uncharacterized protein (DUF1697 family)